MTEDRFVTIRALRAGETVMMEGCEVKMIPGDIEPGDFYVAQRNRPEPRLLTAEKVNSEGGWIVPVDAYAYCYNISECVRVEVIGLD